LNAAYLFRAGGDVIKPTVRAAVELPSAETTWK